LNDGSASSIMAHTRQMELSVNTGQYESRDFENHRKKNWMRLGLMKPSTIVCGTRDTRNGLTRVSTCEEVAVRSKIDISGG